VSSEWKVIDAIDVQARLSISDTSYIFDVPVIVDVPSGHYHVSVRFVRKDGETRVAATRVALSTDVSRGAKVGDVIIDFAQLGVCDRDAFERVVESLTDEDMPTYFNQLQTLDDTGKAELPGAKVVFTKTGYGDGEYPVYELRNTGGERAGVEIDFMEYIRDS
jgi:hypothetical protein